MYKKNTKSSHQLKTLMEGCMQALCLKTRAFCSIFSWLILGSKTYFLLIQLWPTNRKKSRNHCGGPTKLYAHTFLFKLLSESDYAASTAKWVKHLPGVDAVTTQKRKPEKTNVKFVITLSEVINKNAHSH